MRPGAGGARHHGNCKLPPSAAVVAPGTAKLEKGGASLFSQGRSGKVGVKLQPSLGGPRVLLVGGAADVHDYNPRHAL